MAATRSKKPQPPKAKEGRTITLGLKQALVTGLGFVIVLVWVFILGVLVGRGDLYRWLHNLGFHRAELTNPNQFPPPVINGAMVPGGQPEPATALSASKPAPLPTSVSEKAQARPTAPAAKEKPAIKLTAKKFSFQNSIDFSPSKQAKSKTVKPRLVTRSKPEARKAIKTVKKPDTTTKRSPGASRTTKAAIVTPGADRGR
ncbi:MAG: hypothetical protein ACLFUU_11510 [Desulfobacteraceae bacterium]